MPSPEVLDALMSFVVNTRRLRELSLPAFSNSRDYAWNCVARRHGGRNSAHAGLRVALVPERRHGAAIDSAMEVSRLCLLLELLNSLLGEGNQSSRNWQRHFPTEKILDWRHRQIRRNRKTARACVCADEVSLCCVVCRPWWTCCCVAFGTA